jgi:ribose transport system permease protein
MALLSKFSFGLSKFAEGRLILAIVALGLLLALFGGQISLPQFATGPDGKPVRVMVTDQSGHKVPGFEQVNKFFNPRTLVQIAKGTSFFAIMAIGMTLVIITGGIDLSVGSTYCLAAVSGAMVMSQFGESGGGGAAWLGVLAAIGMGALCGFLNGAMIVGFNVHPFIITLGTMAIYQGIAFVVTQGQSIGGFPQAFCDFVHHAAIGDLNLVLFIVMLLVCLVAGIFLSRTAIGRKVYAIAGNETANGYSATRVGSIKLLVYVSSGLAAGITAVLTLGYYGGASADDGRGYELAVIASAVVGGASLVGRKGTALGALLGVIILQMISTGMVILEIPQKYSQIIICLVVIAAVLSDPGS